MESGGRPCHCGDRQGQINSQYLENSESQSVGREGGVLERGLGFNGNTAPSPDEAGECGVTVQVLNAAEL